VTRLSRVAVVAAASVLIGALGMPSAFADGEPDTTFDDDGKAAFDIGGLSAGASTIVKQGSKYVVGGFVQGGGASSRFALARILGNGDPDTTFGGFDGQVVTDFFGESAGIQDLAVLGSGKILAVGHATRPNGNDVFAVARYRSNGQLDPTFSQDGKAVAGFGMDFATASSLLLLSNGSFLVAGTVGSDSVHGQGAVAKFLSDGRLATSFGGGDGLATVRPPGSAFSDVQSVKAGGGGKILIGGTSYLNQLGTISNFLVARLLADGRRDPSFSGDGIATRNNNRGDWGHDLAVLPSGKILLAGATVPEGSPPNVAITRFNANGSPDTAFGVSEVDFGGNDQILDLSVDGLGRLVGAGLWAGSMGVFRFSAMGIQDSASFGSEGAVAVDFPAPSSPSSTGYAVLTPGAKIVVAGSARLPSEDFGFAVARLLA
jgi:serralysin